MQTIKKHAAEITPEPASILSDRSNGFQTWERWCLASDCPTPSVTPADSGFGLRVSFGFRPSAFGFLSLLVATMLLTACAPPGPRAVLKGKRLLEQGECARAIEEFRTATQLLPTNALAFSYLGLALHQSGEHLEAERAYLRALALDHDLTEVHYDLGCLLLSQSNKLDQAKSELTAFTLRRPNSAEGWLKLAEAQLRSRELSSAEKSANDALRLDARNPEVLTTMGLIRYHRRHPNEAMQWFAKALKEQPNYPPALLNLAIVAQQDLNEPRLALESYQRYVALKPPPENLRAVSAILRQIEQDLIPQRETIPNPPLQTAGHTNQTKLLSPEMAASATIPKPTATNAASVPLPLRPEPASNNVKSSTNTLKPAAVTNPSSPEKLEVVRLSAEPVFKPAEDLTGTTVQVPSQPRKTPATNSNSPLAPADARSQKKGFFQRINPINLFTHDEKPATTSTAVPPRKESLVDAIPQPTRREPVSNADARKFPRYTYLSPAKPNPADRIGAERAFGQGVQEQQARRLPEAIQSYRRATQLDPAFYEAHYNLGLAASENRNLPLALSAYENALAIQPESLDARYNFALILRQAGYVLDAVIEFEKILASYPNDGRTHLALGNLYAQQLQEPAKARPHYIAVLEVSPQSPQAGAIRYWLTDHPR